MKQLLRFTPILLLVGLIACGSPPADFEEPASLVDEETLALAEEEGAPTAPEPQTSEPQAPAPQPAYTAPTPKATPKAPPKAAPAVSAPVAQTPPPVVTVTVPAGTELHVTLSTAIDSGISQIGDQLEGTTSAPIVIGNRVAIPAGSTIHGEVVDVVPAKKGLKVSEKGGSVALAFNQVTTPDGIRADFRASLVGTAKSGAKTGAIIGGSAAGGAVLGKVLGDKSKDTAVGAVIGTGIGTAIAGGTKGAELKIPEGTDLIITFDEDLTIRVE